MTFTHKKDEYSNDDYMRHIKKYSMPVSKRELFNTLINEHPNKIWAGNSNFQMLYRPSSQEVFYQDSDLRLELGDIVFLELIPKLAMLKAKIPVGFKITALDEDKGQLTFSYLKDNKSKGVQQLDVVEMDDGIQIVHTSRYRSGSSFRDNHIYEPFHVQFTDQFYVNMEEQIKKKR